MVVQVVQYMVVQCNLPISREYFPADGSQVPWRKRHFIVTGKVPLGWWWVCQEMFTGTVIFQVFASLKTFLIYICIQRIIFLGYNFFFSELYSYWDLFCFVFWKTEHCLQSFSVFWIIGFYHSVGAYRCHISGLFLFEKISDVFTFVGQLGLWPIPLPEMQCLGSLELPPPLPVH